MRISNSSGEIVAEVRSDAEAARWFLETGRRGDYLVETDEGLSDVVTNVFPEASWDYDSYDQVVWFQ